MPRPATQPGLAGVTFVSTQAGRWEPIGERRVHFTSVQFHSDADGNYTGSVTVDGSPEVSEDGQTLVDDQSLVMVTIRDAAGAIVQEIPGAGAPPVSGVRMRVGATGFLEASGAGTPAPEESRRTRRGFLCIVNPDTTRGAYEPGSLSRLAMGARVATGKGVGMDAAGVSALTERTARGWPFLPAEDALWVAAELGRRYGASGRGDVRPGGRRPRRRPPGIGPGGRASGACRALQRPRCGGGRAGAGRRRLRRHRAGHDQRRRHSAAAGVPRRTAAADLRPRYVAPDRRNPCPGPRAGRPDSTVGVGSGLADGIESAAADAGRPWRAHRLFPRSGFAHDGRLPTNADEARRGFRRDVMDLQRVYLANRGIWEAIYSAGPCVGIAHTDTDVDEHLNVLAAFVQDLAC